MIATFVDQVMLRTGFYCQTATFLHDSVAVLQVVLPSLEMIFVAIVLVLDCLLNLLYYQLCLLIGLLSVSSHVYEPR